LTLGAVTAVILEAKRVNTVTVCGITVGFFVVIGFTEILTVVIVTVIIFAVVFAIVVITVVILAVGNRADSRRTTGHEAITN
jgi:uncharacterized membrane protein (UPF0182 family)